MLCSDIEFQQHGARCLANLSMLHANRQLLFEAGVTGPLLSLLHKPAGVGYYFQHALKVLSNIAQRESISMILVRRGALRLSLAVTRCGNFEAMEAAMCFVAEVSRQTADSRHTAGM